MEHFWISLLTLITLAILKRWLPRHVENDIDESYLLSNQARFNRLEKIFGLIFFAILVLLSFGMGVLGSVIFPEGKMVDGNDVVIYPDGWYWFIPAALLSIPLAMVVHFALLKMFLGKDLRYINAHQARKHGNLKLVGMPLMVLLLVLGLASVFMISNWSVSLDDDGVTYDEWLPFRSETMPWDEVERIERIDIGAQNGKNGYQIELISNNGSIILPQFESLNSELITIAEQKGVQVVTKDPQ